MDRQMKMSRFLRMVLTAVVMVAVAAAMPVSSSAAKPIIDGKTKPDPKPKPKPDSKPKPKPEPNPNPKPKPNPKPDTKPIHKPDPTPKPQPKPEPPKPVREERIEFKSPVSFTPFSYKNAEFRMVAVDGGDYMMGCNYFVDQKPEHRETILPFLIGETEVTQAVWEAVMGTNPSFYKGDNLPVENITWYECQEFVAKLNKLFGVRFRLPTEAEWEYAARGGSKTRNYKYPGCSRLADYGWFSDNSGGTTHNVKNKKPNELGLYDMGGNVLEWTQDLYSDAYNKPRNGGGTGRRVFRGGSCIAIEECCTSTIRGHEDPSRRFKNVGLRLAMDAEMVKNTYEVYPDGREQLISSVPYTK